MVFGNQFLGNQRRNTADATTSRPGPPPCRQAGHESHGSGGLTDRHLPSTHGRPHFVERRLSPGRSQRVGGLGRSRPAGPHAGFVDYHHGRWNWDRSRLRGRPVRRGHRRARSWTRWPTRHRRPNPRLPGRRSDGHRLGRSGPGLRPWRGSRQRHGVGRTGPGFNLGPVGRTSHRYRVPGRPRRGAGWGAP